MRQRYEEEITRAKEKTWRKLVEEADERSIWKVKNYIDKPPSPYYIPTINNATTTERKTAEFTKVFFPPPPLAQTADIDNATYPEPVPSNPKLSPTSP
jgi:peptide subunit release factor 1 (eRF1)